MVSPEKIFELQGMPEDHHQDRLPRSTLPPEIIMPSFLTLEQFAVLKCGRKRHCAARLHDDVDAFPDIS